MHEAANILHNATPKSLVLLDEVGRGTSTFDGLSLAWAIVEYLHNEPKVRARTLFATHYHELTELERFLPRVRNYNMAVREDRDGVAFLHKVVPGGCDHSYGIHVARLAGLPQKVIARAEEVLSNLEAQELDPLRTMRGRKRRSRRVAEVHQGRPGAPDPQGTQRTQPLRDDPHAGPPEDRGVVEEVGGRERKSWQGGGG